MFSLQIYTSGHWIRLFEPLLPVSHSVGLPALGQLQGADSRLAPGGDVVVAGVSVEIPAEAAHFVLKPLAHRDAEGVEVVVSNLDVLGCVNDYETFRRGQACHQPGKKGHRHRCAIDLQRHRTQLFFNVVVVMLRSSAVLD